MSYEFGDPAPPRQFKAMDYPGEVVIVIKGGVHEAVKTQDFGVKPATRATVIVLTGRDSGEVFEDTLLWGAQHETFRDEPAGKAVLCRVMAKGRGAIFDVASDYDRRVGNSWVEDNADRFGKLRRAAVDTFEDRDRQLRDEGQRGASTAPTARQFERPVDEEEVPY